MLEINMAFGIETSREPPLPDTHSREVVENELECT